MDLSLSNPNVALFFSGKSDVPPVKEFLYVHTHFIQDNFVSQIEKLVLDSDQVLKSHPRAQQLARKYEDLGAQIGSAVENINEETAPIILQQLKTVYDICLEVLYT